VRGVSRRAALGGSESISVASVLKIAGKLFSAKRFRCSARLAPRDRNSRATIRAHPQNKPLSATLFQDVSLQAVFDWPGGHDILPIDRHRAIV
jgi:hypothetical protein